MENIKHLDIVKADIKQIFLDGHKKRGYFFVDEHNKLQLLNKNDYYEIHGICESGVYVEDRIAIYNVDDYEKRFEDVENIEILYENASDELINKLKEIEGKSFGKVFEDLLKNTFGGIKND